MCCGKSSNEIMILEPCWPKIQIISEKWFLPKEIAGKCKEEKTLKDGLLKGLDLTPVKGALNRSTHFHL